MGKVKFTGVPSQDGIIDTLDELNDMLKNSCGANVASFEQTIQEFEGKLEKLNDAFEDLKDEKT